MRELNSNIGIFIYSWFSPLLDISKFFLNLLMMICMIKTNIEMVVSRCQLSVFVGQLVWLFKQVKTLESILLVNWFDFSNKLRLWSQFEMEFLSCDDDWWLDINYQSVSQFVNLLASLFVFGWLVCLFVSFLVVWFVFYLFVFWCGNRSKSAY